MASRSSGIPTFVVFSSGAGRAQRAPESPREAAGLALASTRCFEIKSWEPSRLHSCLAWGNKSNLQVLRRRGLQQYVGVLSLTTEVIMDWGLGRSRKGARIEKQLTSADSTVNICITLSTPHRCEVNARRLKDVSTHAAAASNSPAGF